MALAGLLQPQRVGRGDSGGARRGKQPYRGRGESAAFRAEGQARDFPVHGRRAFALELFDEKPKLAAMHGKPVPESFTKGQPIAQLQDQKELLCFGPQATFSRFGQSGQSISNYLPHIGSIADDICIVRSMQTEQINHDPAHTFMNTGTAISGRPSMGSWVNYGLGTECDDLPGFVVLTSRAGTRSPQPISSRQWHSGFLPGKFQGVPFHSTGDPVHYVSNPPGVDRSRQDDVITAVNNLNRMRDAVEKNPDIATRIAQYELAFRMQMSVPELVNIADEPKHVLDMYGVQGRRRLVRVQLPARPPAGRARRAVHPPVSPRLGLPRRHSRSTSPSCASRPTRPSAALITDLKQRGMLDDTLVIWGGEFGRTPMAQGDVTKPKAGRDHHIRGFSMWMAGGGIKRRHFIRRDRRAGLLRRGNVVHVHDLHATMLHLLGIDHERLTYRYQGRDFRLTDVAGKVVKRILA